MQTKVSLPGNQVDFNAYLQLNSVDCSKQMIRRSWHLHGNGVLLLSQQKVQENA